VARPLDFPAPERPHRLYFALTNHCNRACPWCSTCSSPRGQTWLGVEDLVRHFPAAGHFEVQLEGGEPTLHPCFWDMVARVRAEPRCTRLVLSTNGVLLPRARPALAAWLDRLGSTLTLKLSINHHLLEHDPGLLALAAELCALAAPPRQVVLNVRLRRGKADDDAQVREAVVAAGLEAHSNVFFLQRYGFAADEAGWQPPFAVSDRFTLVNPDGTAHGQDFLARSRAMGALP
jgi:MoaA/NifB/PqqE/SkfB family radical SAM enzyme